VRVGLLCQTSSDLMAGEVSEMTWWLEESCVLSLGNLKGSSTNSNRSFYSRCPGSDAYVFVYDCRENESAPSNPARVGWSSCVTNATHQTRMSHHQMKSTPCTADDKLRISMEVAAERLAPLQKSQGLSFLGRAFGVMVRTM